MPVDPLRFSSSSPLETKELRGDRGALRAADPTPADGGFTQALRDVLEDTAQAQVHAAEQSIALSHGVGNVHETALALEKADVTLRLLMKGRNKVIEAYQELLRMPI